MTGSLMDEMIEWAMAERGVTYEVAKREFERARIAWDALLDSMHR